MTHSEHEPLGQILFKWLLALFVLGCLLWGFIAHGTEGFVGTGLLLIFGFVWLHRYRGAPIDQEGPFESLIEQEKRNSQIDTDPLFKMDTFNLNHNK